MHKIQKNLIISKVPLLNIQEETILNQRNVFRDEVFLYFL